MRMDVRQREMAEDKAHLGLLLPEELFDDRVRHAAVRALIVAVLEERYRRVTRAEYVIPLGGNGKAQVRGPHCHAHDRAHLLPAVEKPYRRSPLWALTSVSFA